MQSNFLRGGRVGACYSLVLAILEHSRDFTLLLPIGHLHDDVIWLELPECISMQSLVSRTSDSSHHKRKEYNSLPQSILVAVVKWRHMLVPSSSSHPVCSCFVFVSAVYAARSYSSMSAKTSPDLCWAYLRCWSAETVVLMSTRLNCTQKK